MKRTTRRGRFASGLASGLLALLLAVPAWAITVDNVIQMHKSGLPPTVIIQTLQSTGSSFNLTVDDLKKLEQAGVPKAVIEAMMAKGGAAPAPAPEPAPEPAPADDLTRMRNEEEATKNKLEEEDRVREAARRAAEQERQTMAAEEQRRVAEALSKAREAKEDGDYYKAARLFREFLDNADPKKPSALQAKLGLADSLFALKLYGNAAGLYHELLSAGSDNEVFIPAFQGLRKCSQEIAYNPVTLEALTNYFVGNAPKPFQDSYNYFLGKFFFDYNRGDEAKRYLEAVGADAEDYASAQYLLGLIGVQKAGDEESDQRNIALLGAAKNFQAAVIAADAQHERRIAHLGYLALARISYSVGLFDVAIFYYRKVPSDSTNYVNAVHEAGWSYFMKGDVSRGLGIFHNLDGPDWTDSYLPDTQLLESAVFMNTCHFDFAHDAIKRVEDRYLSLKKPLATFLGEYPTPEALYKAFVLGQTHNGIDLPRRLRLAVLSNEEFYDLYTTVTSYRREVARIKKEHDRFGGKLADELLQTVENRQKEGTIALGIKINQLLQGLDAELTDLEVKLTEVKVEIDEQAAVVLENQIKTVNEGGALQEAAAAQHAASIFVGDKYETWPFEGEYWADEINSYRSRLSDVCPIPTDESAPAADGAPAEKAPAAANQ
jgi:hypothetical protein